MVFCGLIWNFRDSDDFRSYNAFLGVNECFYEFKKHIRLLKSNKNLKSQIGSLKTINYN
jgi:hypothetical protein